MRTEVVMPQMGESVAEGTVTGWLKEIGEQVERDEPLFEITTDKVDAEVPSPVAGVLVERRVDVGATVEINTVVAVIDINGASDQPGATEAPTEVIEPGEAGAGAPAASQTPEAVASRAPTAKRERVDGAPAAFGNDVDALRRTRSTPLVRRIAAEHDIDSLDDIPGSGIGGRVTKRDILAHIEAGEHRRPQPAQPQAPPRQTLQRVPQGGGRHHERPPLVIGERDRIEPMTPQRAAIAEHMSMSRAVSAHAHTIHEIDFGRVVEVRRRLKRSFDERNVKLTYTAFIVKAVAEALVKYPVVNASSEGGQIVYRGDVHVGVAVALESSLIVPVVRDVDELSLLGVARAINDLSERARTKRLRPEEVKGGTFTVSNHGIFGPEFGVPIINQPQVAIMSCGAIKKRVVVDQRTDAILVRPTAIFCLSFDHRVIDGATADRFLATVRELIEGWQD